jgi:hypothetical protein
MSVNFNFIGVNFTEFVSGTYESVIIRLVDGTKKEFATGDPVKDFKDALDFAHQNNNIITVYSSSVDNFVMDNENYEYDDNNMLVRVGDK